MKYLTLKFADRRKIQLRMKARIKATSYFNCFQDKQLNVNQKRKWSN